MSIYNMTIDNKEAIERLFAGWWDSLIPSAIAGCMGYVWCNHPVSPTAAQVINADFCYLAGEADRELVLHMPEEATRDFMVIVPLSDKWDSLLKEIYGDKISKVTRYSIKKEPDTIFDTHKLQSFIDKLGTGFELKMINNNEEIYKKSLENEWSEDMCINYVDFDDYKNRGLGVGIVCGDEFVAGASSYTVYPDGIEITIHCRDDYRRHGLATVCGAAIVLECLKRGLHPNWDARTMISVGLAEKLGYHFNREYVAYDWFR